MRGKGLGSLGPGEEQPQGKEGETLLARSVMFMHVPGPFPVGG